MALILCNEKQMALNIKSINVGTCEIQYNCHNYGMNTINLSKEQNSPNDIIRYTRYLPKQFPKGKKEMKSSVT